MPTIFLILRGFIGVILSAQAVQAAFVNETFGFIPIGNTTFTWQDSQNNLQHATSVTFNSTELVNTFPGSYVGNAQTVTLSLGDPVTLNPLMLSVSNIYVGSQGDSQPYQSVNQTAFLSFGPSGSYQFDLTGIRFSSPTGSLNTLTIDGIGTLRDTSGVYADTSAAISFGLISDAAPYANESAIFSTQNESPILPTQSVPIPGAAWLLGSGLVGLIGIRRRRKMQYHPVERGAPSGVPHVPCLARRSK